MQRKLCARVYVCMQLYQTVSTKRFKDRDRHLSREDQRSSRLAGPPLRVSRIASIVFDSFSSVRIREQSYRRGGNGLRRGIVEGEEGVREREGGGKRSSLSGRESR